MKKSWKAVILIIVLILLCPVLVTFLLERATGKTQSRVPRSGKTIVIENESYMAQMDMEDFIPCVLMSQMSIESPKEALKAQAVVLRTYILKMMGNNDSISSKELKLPVTSYGALSKMWFREYRMNHPSSVGGMLGNLTGLGESRVFHSNMEYLRMIMEKTSGKVLKSDGALILPLYHGMSNGMTRDGKEVLGESYEYLKSVECSSDTTQDDFLSIKYVTVKELQEALEKEGIIVYQNDKELFSLEEIDPAQLMKWIDISDCDKSGYVNTIKLGDTKIAAEEFAGALGLRSVAMEISEYEKGIRITTKGEGHGFGMSFSYAKQMAKDGADWQKILRTFYDVTISEY